MNFRDAYYQSGGSGVSHVYVGSPRMRGHGLGSWFSGVFRGALPYLIKGARAVGKEALRGGVNVLSDIGEGNLTFKESLKRRADESTRNLKRKAAEKLTELVMDGSGFKRVKRKRASQSRGGPSRRWVVAPFRRQRGKVRKRRSDKKQRKKRGSKKKKRRQLKNKKTSVRSRKKKSKAVDIFGYT